MSIQAMAWVLQEETLSHGTDRLVLLALANHANDRGEAWPSVQTIQIEANIALPRTVQQALRWLETAGLIATVRQGAPDSRIRADRRPNLYRLTKWLSTVGGPSEGVPLSTGVPAGARRGSLPRPYGGPSQGPQTISEPSKNRGAEQVRPQPAPWTPATEPAPDPLLQAIRARRLRQELNAGNEGGVSA